MTLKTLFTAVGRMEKRTDSPGRSYPVIVLGGKDYMVDLQEMLVWSSLNWRIARKNEIGELYNKAVLDYSFQADRTWNACVERLLIRGLLVSGSGATDYDALYDLLSTMYIIPASGSFPLRLFSFLKLVLVKDVPLSMARRLLCGDKRTAGEKQVMRLAGQTLMSTAEIIKCVEREFTVCPTRKVCLTSFMMTGTPPATILPIWLNPAPTASLLSWLLQICTCVSRLFLKGFDIYEKMEQIPPRFEKEIVSYPLDRNCRCDCQFHGLYGFR